MSAKAAADPATDPARLAKLAVKYPAQVLHNPVLPLLLLEQPDWLACLPANTLAALLWQSDAPATVLPGLLAAAVASAGALARLVAATHPALPPQLLAQLQPDPDPGVQNALRYRADAPRPADPAAALQATLRLSLPPAVRLLAPYIEQLLEALVPLPGVVADDRVTWLTSTMHQQTAALLLQERVAQQAADPGCVPPPATPTASAPADLPATAEAARRYVAARPGGQRAGLAASPLATPALLIALLDHEVAETQRTGASIMHWETLLHRVAGNPASPPALLAWLYLRYATAPAERPLQRWLPELAGSWPCHVYFNATEVVKLPPAAELRELLRHSSQVPPALRNLLAPDMALPELPEYAGDCSFRLSATGQQQVLVGLCTNPGLPPALLLALLDEPLVGVEARQALAAHPAAPPAALRRLATDRALSVARWALANPRFPAPTPTEADEVARRWQAQYAATSAADLTRLAHDKLTAVRTLVAENPATPPAVLAALAHDKLTDVRAATAANAATPPPTLAQLAADKSSLVARAVAANPAAPPALVGELATHADKFVRRQAVRNPRLPASAIAGLLQEKSLRNRLLLLENPLGRAALLHAAADRELNSALLLQLALPDVLTAQHRAALAASPVPAHRLAVAHLPEFAEKLRDDPHLLVRLVARGELALPEPAAALAARW